VITEVVTYFSFGLTVSLKKTEVPCQPNSSSACPTPSVMINDNQLSTVKPFCCLSSHISCNGSRLSRSGTAFGKLTSRQWNDHGIHVDTNGFSV